MAFDRLSAPHGDTDVTDDLMPGAWLMGGKYRVARTISSGGFGITYLAEDAEGQTFVLKECFASALCRRSGTRVRARSQDAQPYFDKVLRCFLNEARTLSSLAHPNVVRIHDVFEENGTAYIALDHIRGSDLFDLIEDDSRCLSPVQVVAIAVKLIGALGFIHDRGIVHCDVSPDNIFITPDLEPILIDFGSARSQLGPTRKPYTGPSMVKDGYSPHEQYLPDGKVGPATDFYALAASLHHLIVGEAPASCQGRIAALADRLPDPCAPLVGRVAGYPPGFLASIDKAMSVMPHARFQSAADWLAALQQPSMAQGHRPAGIFRRVLSFAALSTP